MAIASSGAVSIGSAAGSGRSINVEVGRTQDTANTSMTDVVTAAVTGSTPRGSGSVADAKPHAFSEWYSYVHTQNFPQATYHSRLGSTITAWAVRVFMTHTASEAEAAGGIHIFQREISGDTVFQAELVTTLEADVASQAADNSYFTAAEGGTSASFGSFLNHSSPVSIITIPGVTGITASLSAAPISGYSHTTYPVGSIAVHSSMASLSGFVTRLGGYGAVSAVSAVPFPITRTAYTNWTITISKTGYNNRTLSTFSSYSKNIATGSGY